MVSARNNELLLKDGRNLGYAEYGDPRGKPVFYFHGLPGSRLEARLGSETGRRMGIRIIAVDRPGFGLSDFKPRRKMVDWAEDINELADFLELSRFSILGVSGGGPYAVVCARRMPERLARVGLVCGLGPCDIPENLRTMMRFGRACLTVGRYCQWPVYLASSMVALMIRHYPVQMMSRLAKITPRPDQEVFRTTEIGSILTESFQEAIRRGTRGSVWEILLCSRPWGFSLADITAEVYLWHGEMDITVPPRMGRYLAQTIPGCHARFLSDEGHYSLPVRYLDQILAVLIA